VDARFFTDLLDAYKKGDLTIEQALDRLSGFPVQGLGHASLDTQRHLRCGFPEVILAQGKTTEQVVSIVDAMLAGGGNVLLTRVEPAAAGSVCAGRKSGNPEHNALARTVFFRQAPVEIQGQGPVLVLTAGTADIPVAEEAAVTAEAMGNVVERVYDVGVAGIHRLLRHNTALRRASVLVVAAGMEGALASVVGGLVSRPIVAVPTSTGYGASFHGLAALLSMLNSCAAGVTVVNIDNGFGAGYAASLINRRYERPGE
jgi:NCAIR mutase (PurE)-related protein